MIVRRRAIRDGKASGTRRVDMRFLPVAVFGDHRVPIRHNPCDEHDRRRDRIYTLETAALILSAIAAVVTLVVQVL